MQLPMGGYKTWLAIVGFVALGIRDLLADDVAGAMENFTLALGLLGIGAKVEKR